MKRLLIYIAIVSLGSLLFQPPIQQSVQAKSVQPVQKSKVLASEIKAPESDQKAQEPPSTQSAPQTVQTASTQPTQPVQPVTPPVPTTHEQIAAAAGISGGDFGYVDYIVSHESGWCQFKWEGEVGYCPAGLEDFYGNGLDYDFNLTSRGYGMCQSTPAIKMSDQGSDWATNPVTQLKWCNEYAQARYGSWYGAYIHWINNHNW